jgi:hypothetical protein
LRLAELQARFLQALAGSDGGHLVGHLRTGGPVDRARGLEVYVAMHATRLRDALREDYPRVEAALGEAPFAGLAQRYLARHPSTHPSLRELGRSLPDFIAGERRRPPWLADLARLEWARVEAFDAADAAPLTLEELRAIPAEGWPALRLVPVPSYRRLDSAWAIDALWAAPGRRARRRPTTLRIWREGFEVCHAAVMPLERVALPLLEQGEPFGRLCEAAGARTAPASRVERARRDDPDVGAAAQIGALLLRWVADGLVRRAA